MYNGPNKRYVRCRKCLRIDWEKNEGDTCSREIEKEGNTKTPKVVFVVYREIPGKKDRRMATFPDLIGANKFCAEKAKECGLLGMLYIREVLNPTKSDLSLLRN